jgi:hypothetical protein
MAEKFSKKSEAPIEIYGKKYSGIREAIEKLKPDVTEVTIRARKRYDWTPEEMFGFEKRDKRKEKSEEKKKRERHYTDEEIIVEGVKYNSISEACEKYDINPTVVYNRLAQNKNNRWTIESAILTPKRDRSVVVKGKKYKSSYAAFKEIGKVSFTTYQGRISMGKSLEESLGLVDMNQDN